MIDKRVETIEAALSGIEDGATILLAGFGDVGMPMALLRGMVGHAARNLTLVTNSGGRDGSLLSALLDTGRVRHLICSFVRAESSAGRLLQAGRLTVEIVPQGTLAERMRAAGAGIAAFYTPTGADTLLAEGREVREIDGRNCLLEYPLRGDVALLEAYAADRWGNLVFRESQRNFNPVMAMAAKLAIAEVREFQALGTLDPSLIAAPGVFVDRVVHIPEAAREKAA